MTEFKKSKVNISIRKFRDLSQDLLRADMNTFDDRLEYLIHFCSSDEVFSQIHSQLINNTNIDVLKWHKDRTEKMGNFAELKLPKNEFDRISLMYNILVAISDKRIDGFGFMSDFFITGSDLIDSYILAFNDSITDPLVRELNYKLDEIEESILGNSNEYISSSLFQMINAGDNFTQQILQGNNNEQILQVNNNEIEKLIAELRSTIQREIKDSLEKIRANEIIDGVERELSSRNPNKTVLEVLLKSLPVISSVTAIIDAIMKLL